MKKIVVFGDLPIATKVCMWIKEESSLELIACVSSNPKAHNNDPWEDIPMLGDYCKANNILLYSYDDFKANYSKKSLDLGLCCRYNKIIKKTEIDIFKKGIINMHGGLLPEFAGSYSCNYSVLFNSKIGGGTLHWIDEGIDTGDIIRRCEFQIENDDTGYTVFQKTQKVLYENMIEIILPILNGEITEFIAQKELLDKGYEHHYFDLKSIGRYKKINLSDSQDIIMRTVRAFDFPGYEPAYIECGSSKFYLRTTI
ncbi:MAG: hypothetical protein NC433_07740 [Clostridiales bacterium]|nr:hypothetical protein [Clostridiales bacterium]